MRRAGFTLLLTLASIASAASYEQGQKYYAQGRYEEAYREFMLATWAGDPEAIWALGAMNTYNEGSAKNYAEALALYSDPKNANNVRALTGLGVLYKFGLGVKKDLAKSIFYTEKAANLGDPTATYNLGLDYGDTGQYEKAIFYYQKAEKLGVVQASNNLGLLYKDAGQYPLAFSTLKRAADKGLPAAQVNLAWLYLEGQGTTKNPAQAKTLFEQAANAGALAGVTGLAAMYKDGLGVKQDYQQAAKYYRLAAQAGDIDAQASLGWLYARLENYPEAFKWSSVAAQQGDKHGQFNLARLYRKGLGVAKDDDQALNLFNQSWAQGYAPAASEGATILIERKAYAAALKQLLAAASQGHKGAQTQLGYLYEYGLGIAKNPTEARRWYALAAAQGDDYATKHLAALGGK